MQRPKLKCTLGFISCATIALLLSLPSYSMSVLSPDCVILLAAELPSTTTINLDGMHQPLIQHLATWKDPIDRWFAQGVVLRYEDVGMQDRKPDIAYYFYDSDFSDFKKEVQVHGLSIKDTWRGFNSDFKRAYSVALGFLKENHRSENLNGMSVNDYFQKFVGFYPSCENLQIFENLGRKYLLPVKDIGIVFNPYKDIEKFENRLSGYPDVYKKAIEGIRSFFNDPKAIKQRLNDVVSLVRLVERGMKEHKNPDLAEGEALEHVRRFYELKNGFIDEPKIPNNILTTEEWHSLLRRGIMPEESNDSHSLWSKRLLSFGLLGKEHRRVHRNQWLLIMIEMEKNQERFGNSKSLTARDVFQSLGREDWMYGFLGDKQQVPSTTFHQGMHSRNPWYSLFDNVYAHESFANAANAFYFNEIWTRATGFNRTD